MSRRGESTLEDMGPMSRCEWVCTLWAGGIVDIPAVAHIRINIKDFFQGFEELSYVPLISCCSGAQ